MCLMKGKLYIMQNDNFPECVWRLLGLRSERQPTHQAPLEPCRVKSKNPIIIKFP